MNQLPSWSDGLYLHFGAFLSYPASCFSELVVFSNLLHIFSPSVGTFSGSFFTYVSVPYFGLACDHGNLFLCLEEYERAGTG